MARKEPETPVSKPQIILRFKEREHTFVAGGEYAGLEFCAWVNPPDALRAGCATDLELLLKVLRSWNLETTDGAVAPITADTLAQLPRDLFTWLVREWVAESGNPLAVMPSAEKRNGTPSTATLPGRA